MAKSRRGKIQGYKIKRAHIQLPRETQSDVLYQTLKRGMGQVPKRTCFSIQIRDLMKSCRVTLGGNDCQSAVRTPNYSNSNNVRNVNTDGTLNNNNAYNANGIAPDREKKCPTTSTSQHKVSRTAEISTLTQGIIIPAEKVKTYR